MNMIVLLIIVLLLLGGSIGHPIVLGDGNPNFGGVINTVLYIVLVVLLVKLLMGVIG